MGKIAFVFSGQGDQHPGMGKLLAQHCPAAAAVFQRCEQLRPGTMEQCFAGTEQELAQTSNTQPCLFALEAALAAGLRASGIQPDMTAGFSLGELAAATEAGVFDLETGFHLVCQRGLLMQRDAEQQDTAMMAVLKLPAQQVQELCAQHSQVYAVNFNCPGQVSVSGAAEQMPLFTAEVKAAGGRALPLKVRGGFHSPFMTQAAQDFAEVLQGVSLEEPHIPLYSNVTAQPYEGDPALLLARQINSPVQWETLIRSMIAAGADTFWELGPGKTLSNLIRKIDPGVTVCSALEQLEGTLC